MKKNKIVLIIVLAGLMISSGLRAQFRWHIILPDHEDTTYRGITSISCSGESCTALEVLWSAHNSDSNVILHSTDGGRSWEEIGNIPQWIYFGGKSGLYFNYVQQLDSLRAIAVDEDQGVFIRTLDGWKTWTTDSSLIEAYSNDPSLGYPIIYDFDFANTAEGMMNQGFGFYLSTVDSGNHWKKVIFHSSSSYHSYGNGMFRVFKPPVTIFTTHDNWATNDTTLMVQNGPLLDTSFSPGVLIFGNGDTLAIEGLRWDSIDTHRSMALALSTDMGAHWRELPVPKNNGIYFASLSLTSFNWDHIVLAGNDSAGRILQSTDRGATWELDTVLSSDGVPYYNITNTAVTGSGRVIASIIPDNNYLNSSSLAYLEPVPSKVERWERTIYGTQVYPNPATNFLNVQSVEQDLPIFIYDMLGREVVTSKLSSNGTSALNVSGLPRGIYALRLKEFGVIVTIGMVALVN